MSAAQPCSGVRSQTSAAALSPADSMEALLALAMGHDVRGQYPENPRGLNALVAFIKDRQSEVLSKEQRREIATAATTWSLLEETLAQVSAVLKPKAIDFVLLKGAVTAHLYPLPDLRPTSDLDLLVAANDLERTRQALMEHGWKPMVEGRHAEAYLRQEGSCWQAYRQGGLVVEIHFRFWGSVPTEFAQQVVQSSIQRQDGQRVPCPLHQLTIAAAHGFRQGTPRRAVDFLDVCLLLEACEPRDFENLPAEAARTGQILPVTLSLDIASRVTSAHWVNALVEECTAFLTPLEIRLLRRSRRRGSDSVSWPRVRLATLLSNRPSRAGWRSIVRQFWPHPGVLEQSTPPHLPWPLRRVVNIVRKVQTHL